MTYIYIYIYFIYKDEPRDDRKCLESSRSNHVRQDGWMEAAWMVGCWGLGAHQSIHPSIPPKASSILLSLSVQRDFWAQPVEILVFPKSNWWLHVVSLWSWGINPTFPQSNRQFLVQSWTSSGSICNYHGGRSLPLFGFRSPKKFSCHFYFCRTHFVANRCYSVNTESDGPTDRRTKVSKYPREVAS